MQALAMIASCGAVAPEFMRMIRERDFAAWSGWLEAAKSLCWHASQSISHAIKMPSLPLFGCHGVTARSKVMFIDSSSSNARCSDAQSSICCACASCKRPEQRRLLSTPSRKWTLHQMCG